MKALITFTQEDLLNNCLFVASNTERIKRGRKRLRVALVVLCAIWAIVYSFDEDKFLMWLFVVAGVMLFVFFPFILKYILKLQYNKIAAERFKNLRGLPFEVTFTSDNLSYKSNIGDVLLKTAQIDRIDEVQDYFFIRFSSQDTITLPKRSFDYEALNKYLMDIAIENSVSINRRLNWQWE